MGWAESRRDRTRAYTCAPRAAGLAVCALLAMCRGAPAAFGFGSISGLGQNSEHQRITRLALGCSTPAVSPCLAPASLEALQREVAAPDRGALIFAARAHCDNGDHLDTPGYPQSAEQARANLEACRAWMELNLAHAVEDAAPLVTVDGDPARSAKHKVLADLGLLLHASQDFYAHTNWVDRPDPSQPISRSNPPGLGHSGAAAWIALDGDAPFPVGLISGCFRGEPERLFCNDGGRVKHADLNKDEGVIEPEVGAGSTRRGRVEDNFARAVGAAIEDTREKWALFRRRLTERYGAPAAAVAICAIVSDSRDHCPAGRGGAS
jgi:hypothetical protein